MKIYQVIIFCCSCILPNIQSLSKFSKLSPTAAFSPSKKAPALKCEVLPAYKIIKAKPISATNPVDSNQNPTLYTGPTEYCCGKYFPEVEYPESILDTFTPFYYKPKVYDLTAASLSSKSVSNVRIPMCAKTLNPICGVKAKSTKCLLVSKENSTTIQEIPCREIIESNNSSNIRANKDEMITLESEDKEGTDINSTKTVEVIEVTCSSTTENNASNLTTVCYIVNDSDCVLCTLDTPNEVIAEESAINDTHCIQQTMETSSNTNEELNTQTAKTTLQEVNGEESVAVVNNIDNPVIEDILLLQSNATPEIVENFTIVSELYIASCEGLASLETIEVSRAVLSLDKSTLINCEELLPAIRNTSDVDAPVKENADVKTEDVSSGPTQDTLNATILVENLEVLSQEKVEEKAKLGPTVDENIDALDVSPQIEVV